MMGKGGDDGLRTVECLRGRLLAERVASKAAKAEADLMAKRVAELEMQIAEEMKFMNRAEKRLKYALKKLESLKLSDASGGSNLSGSSMSSSSSSACFSVHRRLEDQEPDLGMVDSGQCGSRGEFPSRLSGSEDFTGDYGSGDSSADSPLQLVSQEGSWSSVGTCSEEAPRRDEANKSLSPHESITDAARQSPLSGNKPIRMKHRPETREVQRGAVPASSRPGSGAHEPEIDSNVHGVLVTLSHVREQLQDSLGRRADVCSHKELCSL